MQTLTLLLCVGAFICALGVALFQYRSVAKPMVTKIAYTILRFISVFALLLLLINPEYTTYTFQQKKPKLVVAVDHSASMKHLNQEEHSKEWVANLKANAALNAHFDIDLYSFSNTVKDTLDFKFTAQQTNIAKTLKQLKQMYPSSIAPMILISDGNQTYGTDYQYSAQNYKQSIYPVVLGDTTKVVDTKIKQVNVNTYAYLNNEFPVEVLVNYTGKESFTTTLTITSNAKTLYSKPITFSETEGSQIIALTLPASQKGVHTYKATLGAMASEKNRSNNTKEFAIEVIDQKTNVALVSELVHPDLGMIKKSIESNERRRVTILKPREIKSLEAYQFVILFNPSRSFSTVFEAIKKENKNILTITGIQTDWRFLNQVQSYYTNDMIPQKEYYTPKYNPNFGTFLTENIAFENYPPLQGFLGTIKFTTAHDVLLYRSIENVPTDQPLLTTFEDGNRRQALLLGEGIWQWRAHSFKTHEKFTVFDEFWGKIIQYLSNTTVKTRLRIDAAPFYYENATTLVKAEYFTKNFEFDRRGSLTITVKNQKTQQQQSYPMILNTNMYSVDMSDLTPGTYEYTVTVANEKITASGKFSVVAYDVEQQFLNADIERLTRLAERTKGKVFFPDQIQQMIPHLIQDKRYQTIQESKQQTLALIDWKYILILLIVSLSIEWFLRKYNGLI